jgi:hypothetical protein
VSHQDNSRESASPVLLQTLLPLQMQSVSSIYNETDISKK